MTAFRNVMVLVGALSVAACTDESTLSSIESNVSGPVTVTTDGASYTYATSVFVSWSGSEGNATDWIAIAPAGSDLTNVTRWKFAPSTSGTVKLEGPNTGGDYVARAFENDSYTLIGESATFHVDDASETVASLSVDLSQYDIDTPVTVNWTGLPPNDLDWVALTPQGRPDTTEAIWQYTRGQASGSYTFQRGLSIASLQGFPGGQQFVARLYLNDTYTRVAETAPFLVGAPTTTDAATYPANTPITVNWTHAAGSTEEWIALAPAGSTPTTVTKWMFSPGTVDGSMQFPVGLATAGTYVARVYAPNFYFITGESAPFEVTPNAAATVTTDATTYAIGQGVPVSWSGLPGNASDWISIAPAGSSDTTATRWVYTGGQASGTFSFEGPPSAGSYVARAFLNDSYVKLGESAPFDVN